MRALAAVGLVLALGGIGAAVYVLAEPVRAIEALREDPGDFSKREQREMILGRYHEAKTPLFLASLAGAAALAVSLSARRHPLGAVAILVACVTLAAAAYLWARYGAGILGRLS